PIEVQFSSFDRDLMEPAVARVVAHMDTIEGLRDIEDTRSLPGLEWRLTVDRAQAALYGADVTSVGFAVQLITNGVKIGEYRPDRSDDAVDIRVRYPEKDRGISALDQLKVRTSQGQVPISNFVTREAANNIDTIQRVDGNPVEYIRAGVGPDVLADDKVKELRAWLETQQFDPRLKIEFRGADEEQQESQQFTTIAFGLSLLLMFVLLVTQFNSLYQALLILFAVVMSTAGVLLGLLVTDRPFSSLLTGIGIVALAGIVVNNNIVLIDTFNNIRKSNPGLDYVTLITRTGAQRLRPVLLTTLTTIFGLLPLAMNFSVDLINRTIVHGSQMSGMWVPLSQAIVSGMAFASILTLVATPAMLALPYQTVASFEHLDKNFMIRARFAALRHRIDAVIPALLRRGD
ncbi:MAG: efflux RND transporter permease subunit, partial [Pseudomonadales bacterium]|nr:efflux RND transporter permease subunit [Pseudomonadales bacterium]